MTSILALGFGICMSVGKVHVRPRSRDEVRKSDPAVDLRNITSSLFGTILLSAAMMGASRTVPPRRGTPTSCTRPAVVHVSPLSAETRTPADETILALLWEASGFALLGHPVCPACRSVQKGSTTVLPCCMKMGLLDIWKGGSWRPCMRSSMGSPHWEWSPRRTVAITSPPDAHCWLRKPIWLAQILERVKNIQRRFSVSTCS
mmetsp:Transcript_30760/g.73251  ORF Transcript_30760/g.73251 Transcript_30760/m.73251 type:complete len:203 (-) Transcript_30760:1195-1803(-)